MCRGGETRPGTRSARRAGSVRPAPSWTGSGRGPPALPRLPVRLGRPKVGVGLGETGSGGPQPRGVAPRVPGLGCAARAAAEDASGRGLGQRPRVPGVSGAGASSSAKEVRSPLCRAGGARGGSGSRSLCTSPGPSVSQPSAPILTSSRRPGAGSSRGRLLSCRGLALCHPP